MAYCTDTGLSESRLIELTDDALSGMVDASKVTAAILWADTQINGYCGGRYAVPFDPVPVMIAGLSQDLAVWKLYLDRSDYQIPEAIRQRYEDAIGVLKRISDGSVVLPIQLPNEEYAGVVLSNKTASDRVFTDDVLKSY